MHNEKYWNSKIPVVYALLFVLNVALIVLFEILVLYTLPQDLTPEILAQENPAYENCRILSRERADIVTCYLVELENGDLELVTTRQHNFLYMRCRLLEKQTAPIPAQGQTTVQVKLGIHTVPVTVENGSRIEPFSFVSTRSRNAPTMYMVLGAVLELMELMAYGFVKRNL